ncbi:TetR/AcrR family transcriptional regulator [Desulfovibrio inopinatus]|uniref:TetR/AcrR family transcriptional regulator n=1 Tax=Desulfovibrio inopinatus TaxID=102109 RepID=UPI000686DDBF
MQQSTKKRLISHALKLFSNKGYDGVGVQQIVDAGKVSKPTLYHHFQNKKGLLNALLEEELTPLLVSLEQLAFTTDFEQDLVRCGLVISDYAKAHSDLYRLFLCLMFAPPESPQFEVAVAYGKRQFSAVENVFLHHHHEKNKNSEDAIALYAANFQGLLHNLITLYLHGHIQLDTNLVTRSVHMFVYGMYAVEPFNIC